MILTNLFQIDGKSLYAPDCDIEPSYSDLDASDSGRDEAGYMHREVVREKVATWPIAYSLSLIHIWGQVSVPQLSQAGDQTCQDWVNDLRPKPLNNVAHILHD